jgi:polysaccharide export outer membrane protein
MEATMARQSRRTWQLTCALLVLAGAGCTTTRPIPPYCIPQDVPRELDKASLPAYVVEPPDILVIEALRMVPKGPYRIEPLDTLFIQPAAPVPGEATNLVLPVDPDGTINLGPAYGGTVRVAGMTLAEAKAAVEKASPLKNPTATVGLYQTRGAQRITGTHLVRPDGTVGLGQYGDVRVAGLTLELAKKAIEARLSEQFVGPEVAVDVQGFNSKLVYVILDGGGAGQQVVRLPFTGNETVLDAIAQVYGLSPVSSTDNIWVARPGPAGSPAQVLPVNWQAVAALGETGTNYQLLPGDRVYVAAQHLVATDTFIARLVSPLERLFGVTLLGNVTVRSLSGQNVSGFGVP